MRPELIDYVRNYINILTERSRNYENSLVNSLNPLDRLLFLEKIHEVNFSIELFQDLEKLCEEDEESRKFKDKAKSE